MGGCASKPKDLDVRPESVPSEAPASPKKAEGEAVVAQENVNDGGDKTQKEEPLVDLSEPKEEAKGDSSSESKPADEPVVSIVESKPDETTATPTKETVEKPSEKEAEAGKEETKEPAKEVKQAEVVEVTKEAKTESSSEDKSDAPLVTV